MIIYDARTDGTLLQIWWPFVIMISLSLLACYGTWRANRDPSSFWGKRRVRARAAGEKGIWDKRHPSAYAFYGFCFFSLPMVWSLINWELISHRMAHHVYQTWSGTLTSDTVEHLGSRRRTTLERDTLWISGMRFTISCWVRPVTPLKYGSPGSCNGLIPGQRLTAVYLPLPQSRYRLAAVQLRLMQ